MENSFQSAPLKCRLTENLFEKSTIIDQRTLQKFRNFVSFGFFECSIIRTIEPDTGPGPASAFTAYCQILCDGQERSKASLWTLTNPIRVYTSNMCCIWWYRNLSALRICQTIEEFADLRHQNRGLLDWKLLIFSISQTIPAYVPIFIRESSIYIAKPSWDELSWCQVFLTG